MAVLVGNNHFPNLVDLSGLERLQSLRSLELIGCPEVADLSPLKELQQLNSLELSGFPKIRSLSPLWELTQLRFVALSRCEALDEEEVDALRRKLPECAVLLRTRESLWDLKVEVD